MRQYRNKSILKLKQIHLEKEIQLPPRFREFTAGHYSSATGTATLIDEDDESPIIRGFGDDEPLVM